MPLVQVLLAHAWRCNHATADLFVPPADQLPSPNVEQVEPVAEDTPQDIGLEFAPVRLNELASVVVSVLAV